MKDRIPSLVLPNGALRYGIYDESGNLLRYEYIRPEDEPTEDGTPVNKATLLSDATAALFGKSGDASTVNNVLYQIGARATCTTAAATTAKTAALTGFTRATGAIVRVTFSNTNSSASPTLNINSTGAASIRYANAALPSPDAITAGVPHLFMFDGTYWQLLNPFLHGWAPLLDVTFGELAANSSVSYTMTDSITNYKYVFSIYKGTYTDHYYGVTVTISVGGMPLYSGSAQRTTGNGSSGLGFLIFPDGTGANSTASIMALGSGTGVATGGQASLSAPSSNTNIATITIGDTGLLYAGAKLRIWGVK